MAYNFRHKLSSILCNFWCWRTKRRIVVFESDDWGGVRVPSAGVAALLERRGVRLSGSPFNKVDCLESRSDLDALLNLISSHNDINGRPVIFTTYNVVANPDFQRIQDTDFREYHFEKSGSTYQRYFGEDLDSVWRRAISDRLLEAQFHAREHLNTGLWLDDLRSGHRDTLKCFDFGFFGHQRSRVSPQFYMAAYWPLSTTHLSAMKTAINDGLELFQSYFGYSPTNFVACDYVLPRQIEKHISETGIKGIQTQRGFRAPSLETPRDEFVYPRTGLVNKWGGLFTVRNATFEPSLFNREDHVDRTMAEIRMAFRFNCPAVISTHRANYVSGIDARNSGSTLRLLEELLVRIKKTWPTVEFLSSSELLNLISEGLPA
jgi:hypothetical protein